MEVFFNSWQVKIKGLFDTQVGWGFVTGELSLGYAGLVNRLLNVIVDKEETQTDWLQRPLTENQLNYAAKDVFYLIPLYKKIYSQLKEHQSNLYFKRECQQLCDYVTAEFDPEYDYRQAKEVWKLDGLSLSLFKLLFNWRETLARQKNITKNRIVKDQDLVQIALRKPMNRHQLASMVEMHPRSLRHYSEVILTQIKQWQCTQSRSLNPVLNPRDVDGLNRLIKKIEQQTEVVASQLSIPTTLLASKRLIRQVAYAALCDEKMPLAWQGWRHDLLGHLLV